ADGPALDGEIVVQCVTRGPGGEPSHLVGLLIDLRERRALETELRQAQKMEAVGQLAGGVAHDFNNLLTAILGFAHFARERTPEADPRAGDLDEIVEAARRGQSLASQLLAYSRRKSIAPRIVDLTERVRRSEKMLRTLLREDVALVL